MYDSIHHKSPKFSVQTFLSSSCVISIIMSPADLQLLFNYTHKRKKWLLLALALGFSSYGARRVYQLPSLVEKRNKLSNLFTAVTSVAELVSDSAETIGVVSNDLKHFIQSDSDEIPNSLKQVSKIARSSEFAESVIGITRSLTMGIYRGYKSEASLSRVGTSFSDRALDKLFSKSGSGFASAVVGSFARNIVTAVYSEINSSTSQFAFDPQWVDVICDDKMKQLIGDCVRVFVSTAVDVYLDKTMHINTYEEIFSGMTNPNHEMQVRDALASIVNGAVETFVRTSHQVLTTPDSELESNSNSGSSRLYLDLGRSQINVNEKPKWQGSMKKSCGWVNKVSNTLAVPKNRRMVLDLTGRVTFESVRSFLQFMVERSSESLKRKVDVVHKDVVDQGIEALRYITVKSSAVVSICLSLCLHILSRPWILVPP